MENKNNLDFSEVNIILEAKYRLKRANVVSTSTAQNRVRLSAQELNKVTVQVGQGKLPISAKLTAQANLHDAKVEANNVKQSNNTTVTPSNPTDAMTGQPVREDISYNQIPKNNILDPKQNLDSKTLENKEATGVYKKGMAKSSKTLQAAGSLDFLYKGTAGDLMKEIVETGSLSGELGNLPEVKQIITQINFSIKQYTKGKNVEHEKRNLMVLKTRLREIVNKQKI